MAIDGACRLGGNGPARWRAATAHGTAAAMKEADSDACVFAHTQQPPLGFKQFKAGAEEAAVLVAVGIAEHDFLPAAAVVHRFLYNAGGQKFLHDGGAGA